MNRRGRPGAVLAGVLAAASCVVVGSSAPRGEAVRARGVQPGNIVSRLPLAFEPNVGQSPPGVSFGARVGGGRVELSGTSAVVAGDGEELRIGLRNAREDAHLTGTYPLGG